jgi:beta-galactosidase
VPWKDLNRYMMMQSRLTAVMTRSLFLWGAIFISIHIFADEAPRERLLMDSGWKFHLGNSNWGTGEELINVGISTGPADPNFNDKGWASVVLPHDWAVALPFDQKADHLHGFKPIGPGYPQNSIAWYRRTFTLPQSDLGRRLWIEFGGVYRDSLIYLNGCLIGRQQRGYNSFRYDISDVANVGGKNVLVVRVNASQPEGWFYEGAGIYRHVWLVKTSPLAGAPDGTFIQTQFADNVPTGPCKITVQTKLLNEQAHPCQAQVSCEVLDPDGNVVGTNQAAADVAGWSPSEVEQTISVAAPVLWSPETPRLYRLRTTIRSGDAVTDQTETEFGIRTLAFDPDRGFLLNGQPYVIKGTCNHQDHAGVGWALPDALQYFRIAKMKEMGSNALRTTHNEPTEELLEACDRLGMLVMDESRTFDSSAENLEQLANQVRRDRNHPSVFLWSLGNEEPKQSTPMSARMAQTMQTLVHQLDPTRLVTYAAAVGNEFTGINSVTDVRGWNYDITKDMDNYHREHPTQPEIGSEQASTTTTRGMYDRYPPGPGYRSAYDDANNLWKGRDTAEAWCSFFAQRPWLSGGFAWTGFDYRGENEWPCVSSNYGILDTCGFPKDNFYYYLAWWGDKPVLHLFPHWNWAGKEGQAIDVRCFGNCDEVELFLNGQSQGRQTMPKYGHLEWKLAYAPGTLSAKGYSQGREIVDDQVETTGDPVAIKLTPNRTNLHGDGEDVSMVTVEAIDDRGRVVPTANNKIQFHADGGTIIGVGNGDPECLEADRGDQRSLFNGLAQVIVQAPGRAGTITLSAESPGLMTASVTLNVDNSTPRAFVP